MASTSTAFAFSAVLLLIIIGSLSIYSSRIMLLISSTVPTTISINATTVPATTYSTIPTTNVIINASEELNNSLKAGFAFNYSVFSANSTSDCELVQISQCWNNAPSQAVCINKAYNTSYHQQYNSIRNSTGPVVCAMYYTLGNMTCTVMNNSCTLVDTTTQPA